MRQVEGKWAQHKLHYNTSSRNTSRGPLMIDVVYYSARVQGLTFTVRVSVLEWLLMQLYVLVHYYMQTEENAIVNLITVS